MREKEKRRVTEKVRVRVTEIESVGERKKERESWKEKARLRCFDQNFSIVVQSNPLIKIYHGALACSDF